MTAWLHSRARRAAALGICAAGLLAAVGCDPRSMLYFLQPFEPTIAPPCPSLKGKRVVVVCTANPITRSDNPTLDRDLTKQVVAILKESVKKIDVVEPEKVATWVQGNPSWTDPADLARAFEADAVISLEVEHFEIENPNSPNLFEGKSDIHVVVTSWDHPKDAKGRPMKDKAKEAKEIFNDSKSTAFPVTGHIPMGPDVTRTNFKAKFMKLVSTEVSWLFVEHAPGDNIQDTRIGGGK